MSSPTVSVRQLPANFWVWLIGAALTNLGTQVAIFGLAWSATATSASLAGLLLTLATVPRIALTVLGGVAADRHGPVRILLGCGAATVVLGLGASVLVSVGGAASWPLYVLALGLGTISAFYIPASGVMPRLLVGVDTLPRAMASWQIALQATTLAAAPLGGVFVSALGLRGSLYVLSASSLVAIGLIVSIRRHVASIDRRPGAGSYLARIKDGFRVAATEKVIRDLILLLVAVAGFLLPVTSLLVPILARDHGWGPAAAGVVAGGFTAGGAIVSIGILVRGAWRRPGFGAIAGPAVSATGIALLSVAPTKTTAVVCAAVAGAGTSLFTSHAGPILMGSAPQSHIARVQAVMLLAQNVPLLVANTAIGAIADSTSATLAALFCAAGIGTSACLAWRSQAIRSAGHTPKPEATRRHERVW